MMARATDPRAAANKNDLSEDKRLHPEQSGHLSRPRRSGQAANFRPVRAVWENSHSHRAVLARPAECRFSTGP